MAIHLIALAAANHWNELANDADAMGAWEAEHARYAGVYANKSATYRRTAWALALEAETGEPHCSDCFGNHANHLHRFLG